MNETLLDKTKSIKLHPLIETAELKDIDDSTYFGKTYENYVSNSRLGLINPAQDGSPANYFQGFKSKKLFSDSLVLGSAVHELILQPDDYAVCEEINRPPAKLGYFADEYFNRYKAKGEKLVSAEIEELKDYFTTSSRRFFLSADNLKLVEDYASKRKEFEASLGESSVVPIYLSAAQRELTDGCVRSLTYNAAIKNLLEPQLPDGGYSLNENAILLDVVAEFPDKHEEILQLKSKLDNFSVNPILNAVTINDVKTTSRFCGQFGDAFNQFHYYREFGMYSFMLCQYLTKQGLKNFSLSGNCLVVETATPAHESTVYAVTPQQFIRGIKEMKLLLKLVAYYTRYGY